MKNLKGEKGLQTSETFHHQAVLSLLQTSTAVEIKKSLTCLMEKSLTSEFFTEFPEELSEHYYSYRLLHNFLVQLIFLHEPNLKPEHFMLFKEAN